VERADGRVVVVRALVGRRVDRRGGDGERELASADAELDRTGRELNGDLVGGVGEGVLQREPNRGVEWRHQPAGESPGVVAAGLGREGDVPLDLLYVGFELHGTTLAPGLC